MRVATDWLNSPNTVLKDLKPIELLETLGIQQVETILRRIGCGVYS
ncbi:MAG: MbcA/ParS/Xre antitoxin family protein [Terriglobia bacterium]|nr:MbcA/ParS/Xre antitoxin family protein [Terriglobia bacterium]